LIVSPSPSTPSTPGSSSSASEINVTSRSALATFFFAYFDAQFELLRRFKPEVVGHFDLCRLYTPSIRFNDDPSYAGVWEKVRRNVEYAIGYGACFELNAAAFRKGWKTAYPGEDVLKLIVLLGGRLVLSDDAHGPSAVGMNYNLLIDYMNLVGVKDLWYLQVSKEGNTGGRRVRAVKMPEDWRRGSWFSRRMREVPVIE